MYSGRAQMHNKEKLRPSMLAIPAALRARVRQLWRGSEEERADRTLSWMLDFGRLALSL